MQKKLQKNYSHMGPFHDPRHSSTARFSFPQSRSRNSRNSFQMTRRARPILKRRAGTAASNAHIAKPVVSRSASPTGPVLRCRNVCRKDNSLTAGTVMERTHTPLTIWFWAAYLVSSMTPGMSAVQFQRQLGLTRYETAFQILHKLRAGMVRPGRDRIGGKLPRRSCRDRRNIHRRQDARRGQRRPCHDQTLVIAAVEVRTAPAQEGRQRRAARRPLCRPYSDGNCAGSHG